MQVALFTYDRAVDVYFLSNGDPVCHRLLVTDDENWLQMPPFYPSILVELGNMKNPADSALMKTPEGRQKYAEAVVRGIAAFLAAQRG